MSSAFLRISVRFLDASYHGRTDGSEPEWPPSPLRLFQALVCAASLKFGEEADELGVPALRWLEQQTPPKIVAPEGIVGEPYCLAVPNNAMDIVARSWVRRNLSGKGDADRAKHKAMKTVRPVRVVGGAVVHYLWTLPASPGDEVLGYVETLCLVARSIVVLGWGTDLVAAEGRVVSQAEVDALQGDEWHPVPRSTNRLRVPKPGTLADLSDRYHAFLNRMPAERRFRPVPALSTFATVGYRRSTDPAPGEFAAFQLLKPDASAFRAFSPTRDLRRVVGMLRNATAQAARISGWDEATVASRVLGHGETRGEKHQPVQSGRFVYVPVPSIESRGPEKARVVGPIRRVLIASLDEMAAAQIPWARRLLSGSELIDEESNTPTAILSLVPGSDSVIRRYAPPRGASVWFSVTPVVLPGFDDCRQSKCEELFRKAIRHAGYSNTLADHAEIEWRKVGFLPGVDLATRYRVPDYLHNFPRYHVRIAWKDPNGRPVRIGGPLCLGGGRYFGLGLFVAGDE